MTTELVDKVSEVAYAGHCVSSALSSTGYMPPFVETDPGHQYSLRILDDPQHYYSPLPLFFVKRDMPPEKYPGNQGSHPGTTLQEVTRALIRRCKYVNSQIPAEETEQAISCYRLSIQTLEKRAARRHGIQLVVNKLPLDIEELPICVRCGHIACQHNPLPPFARWLNPHEHKVQKELTQ